MLQQDHPDDYVIATGENHSVREFVELAFKALDIEIEWQGSGIFEVGVDKSNNNIVIKIDPNHYRPPRWIFSWEMQKPKNAELET